MHLFTLPDYRDLSSRTLTRNLVEYSHAASMLVSCHTTTARTLKKELHEAIRGIEQELETRGLSFR